MIRIIPFRRSPLTLAAFLISCISAPLYAQTQPVALAWDANPDPSVAGYIVYVGNAPGSYAEQYDVGSQTSFVYTKVSAGRPYYFAVAAYTSDDDVGAASGEIFFLSGPSTGSQLSGADRAAQLDDAADSSSPSAAPSAMSPSAGSHAWCGATGDASGCYEVSRLLKFPGNATSLTPTGDGRLLFIADGTQVRVIAGDTLMPDPALTADGSTRLGSLVLDPLFDRNRYIYVTEILTRPDGLRELSVVRYREVASTFAEGAAVVTGIPLPQRGDAPFTIDATRRLYIAVPDSSDGFSTGSPYGGMVLRFESDGSVPRNSRGGSPVLARGYAEPASLAWSAVRNELWLAGAGSDWDGSLARLPLGEDSAAWPRQPASAGLDGATSIVSLFSTPRTRATSASGNMGDGLILVADDGGMLYIDAQSRRARPAVSLSVSELGGEPISAALDGVDIYIVLTPATDRSDASEIARLRRIN